MKIIFDSEEQKDKYINRITWFCPKEFGLVDRGDDDCGKDDDCSKCWKNAVEMEVKGD